MKDTRLYDLREDNDLLQKDIASSIGVSPRTYSSWETDTKTIPLKHLNTLCNYYNVSMDYVLKLSNKKEHDTSKKVTTLDKQKIGKRINEFRTNQKLTIRKLASELNTTASTISAYEHGKTLILTSFAYQICKNYHLSLDWLCGRIN